LYIRWYYKFVQILQICKFGNSIKIEKHKDIQVRSGNTGTLGYVFEQVVAIEIWERRKSYTKGHLPV
jgi:hypothetical protein